MISLRHLTTSKNWNWDPFLRHLQHLDLHKCCQGPGIHQHPACSELCIHDSLHVFSSNCHLSRQPFRRQQGRCMHNLGFLPLPCSSIFRMGCMMDSKTLDITLSLGRYLVGRCSQVARTEPKNLREFSGKPRCLVFEAGDIKGFSWHR